MVIVENVSSNQNEIPIQPLVPSFTQPETAFDYFCTANRCSTILSSFNRLCDLLDLNPAEDGVMFYRLFRARLSSYWKAHSLFTKLDKRVLQKEYKKQMVAHNYKALVIGAGPAGLRCAIELALCGCTVYVVEKRDCFSRNNVLHLWPFVIHDLKALGAKTFFGKFCAGSIDHISIQTLQCILLKICLIFGVQLFTGVGYEGLIEPKKDKLRFGWRARVTPPGHLVSSFEFNVLIGANGKQCNIDGFRRKEFRGRLAIAITANFVNYHTEAEARVEEISGVAFIFNQKFFKDLNAATGIDLENIVYYKNETHYFVMTAKKSSLLAKGVLKQDRDDPRILLNPKNICRESLQAYAREAAAFSTHNRMPQLNFATTVTGQPDVAVFDFTSLFAAEISTRAIQREGKMLTVGLIGDSLLEPFWPTGSGCARGFLSAMDTAWSIRQLGRGRHVLEVLAERESVYQRLSQTTPQNMFKQHAKYTIDPKTRYPSLNQTYKPDQMLSQVDTDDPLFRYVPSDNSPAHRRGSQLLSRRPSPSLGLTLSPITRKKRGSSENILDAQHNLIRWFQIKLDRYSDRGVAITDLSESWSSGIPFLCLIHSYRPHLIDIMSLSDNDPHQNLHKAFTLLKKEFGVDPPELSSNLFVPGQEGTFTAFAKYLDRLRDNLKTQKSNKKDELETSKAAKPPIPAHQSNSKNAPSVSVHRNPSRFLLDEPRTYDVSAHARLGLPHPNKTDKEGLVKLRKDLLFKEYKSGNGAELTGITPVSGSTNRTSELRAKLFGSKEELNETKNSYTPRVAPDNRLSFSPSSIPVPHPDCIPHNRGPEKCCFCGGRLSKDNTQKAAAGYRFHSECFRCATCRTRLDVLSYALYIDQNEQDLFYCASHYKAILKQNQAGPSLRPEVVDSRHRNGVTPRGDQVDGDVKSSSSVRRSAAFYIPSVPDLQLLPDREGERGRSISAPPDRKDSDGSSSTSSKVNSDIYGPGTIRSSLGDSVAPMDPLVSMSWDDVVARCKILREDSTEEMKEAGEPQNLSSLSNRRASDSASSRVDFFDYAPPPIIPPRTVFLDDTSSRRSSKEVIVCDTQMVEKGTSAATITTQLNPASSLSSSNDSITSFIEIGSPNDSLSRLSSIAECESIFEKSLSQGAKIRGLVPKLNHIPDQGTLTRDTVQRSESTSRERTLEAERGRKKVVPLISFDSLTRDVWDFRRAKGETPSPVYDQPVVSDGEEVTPTNKMPSRENSVSNPIYTDPRGTARLLKANWPESKSRDNFSLSRSTSGESGGEANGFPWNQGSNSFLSAYDPANDDDDVIETFPKAVVKESKSKWRSTPNLLSTSKLSISSGNLVDDGKNKKSEKSSGNKVKLFFRRNKKEPNNDAITKDIKQVKKNAIKKKSSSKSLGKMADIEEWKTRAHNVIEFDMDHSSTSGGIGSDRGIRRYRSEGNLLEDNLDQSADSSYDTFFDSAFTPLTSSPSQGSLDDVSEVIDSSTEKGRRQMALVRLRKAQEIQRQLQEVELRLAEMDLKGQDLHNRLRRVTFLREQGDTSQGPDNLERQLQNEMMLNVAEKNQLVRFESDLTIEAKELELEDRQARLEEEYRVRTSDKNKIKSETEKADDKKILLEYVQVVEERNSLVQLQDEHRLREAKEDAQLLEALNRRGIHFLPMSYVTKIQLGCTQESGLI